MTKFKVATWNLENLYSPGSTYGPGSVAEYEAKLDSLAAAILKLDPDVLAVQEVGDNEALTNLVAKLQNRYHHTRLSAHPDSRGIRVGFVSKLELHDPVDFVAFPEEGIGFVPGIDSRGKPVEVSRMGRGALLVAVKPGPDCLVHLMTAHLKSKLLTYPSRSGRARFSPQDEDERAWVAGIALMKRTAEAVTLRVKANALLAENDRNALILLGDLNDVVNAATTQILKGPGGSEINNKRAFNRADQGDDTRLWNLAHLIPANRRYSRKYKGTGELIDHIFVSQELLPGKPRRLPEVDSHVDAIGDGLPVVDDNPGLRLGEAGSDHAPITAIFEL
jgi:endonuclease/exonuclease/phosphatase family metal-dependent hydrolase